MEHYKARGPCARIVQDLQKFQTQDKKGQEHSIEMPPYGGSAPSFFGANLGGIGTVYFCVGKKCPGISEGGAMLFCIRGSEKGLCTVGMGFLALT